MPAPQISPLPTPPSRSQSPETFSADADAFLGALPEFQTDANAQADYLDALAIDVTADVAAAEAAVADAEAAAAVAAGAANYQGDYSAGTTYQIGESVSYLGRRYVAKTVNTGVTPADGANWFLINDGDVLGPVSATNNSLAAFDGATGKLIKEAGTVSVGQGGTGVTSLTENAVLVGNGTSAIGSIAAGASGNVLTSNGTTWASIAPPPSGPTLQAIASGTLADGSTVIVNADGTVSAVAGVLQTVGSATVFESASTSRTAVVYDANAQTVVIAYADGGNSNYGTAVVGTVSGTSISFGTPVVFASVTTSSSQMAAAYDAVQQKVTIGYRDETGALRYGYAVVGTVSGTSISFGTPVLFSAGETLGMSATYEPVAQKVVFAYKGTSDYGRSRVGTISGTSISFGTEVVFESAAISDPSITYDANAQKVVIAYTDQINSNYGTAIVGTVSGTSISFGTAVVFESAATAGSIITYDANAQKVVIAYTDSGNSGYGTAIVGTVSGTSISFGTAVVFESASTTNIFAAYDANAQKVVIAYADAGNSSYGTAVVFQVGTTNLTSENFIGFSSAAYTNGQTATIQIVGGVDDAQSGLTAGQSYFVQPTGLLGLTATTPSVFAGTAVAATKIIVKG